jgi:hypothetical protein
MRSCAPAFHIDSAAMLQENASLESICIQRNNAFKVKDKRYPVPVSILQHNKTLKSLNLKDRRCLTLTDDEDKQMAALLQKNYAMESLPDIDLEKRPGNGGAILRPNKAGRGYLIEDGSSISKGVKVLIAVSNEVNCLFLHLLENPTLCDRSAVEAASESDSTDNNCGSTSLVYHTIGKREHGRAQPEGKEVRRRLP